MNIGDAARRTNLPTKTIRYYEDIGLIMPTSRQANGFRDYDSKDLHRLAFVQRARSLGFSIEQCRELLALYTDPSRASADVKAVAAAHLTEIDRKIKELSSLKATLGELVDKCQGDHRPDCPILKELSASP